jgi:hypothetical protein
MKANRLLSRVGTIDRRSATRYSLAIAIVLLSLLSFVVYNVAESKRQLVSSANNSAAWNATTAKVPAESLTLNAFSATWAAQRATNGGQATLAWSARDARDLRASLLALDATKQRVQRIDVVRRESGFTITAEIAQ